MAVHSIKRLQRLPVTLAEAWDFFSNPANLQKITPQDMGFTILSGHEQQKMYAGQLIEYRVRPLWNLPLYWMTEITHVVEGQYFVDEQRFGPYSLWHHQHHFRAIDRGVEMIDIVHYKIPFWIVGDVANSLFVKRRLDNIFSHRHEKVEELLGRWQ